jgi:hypothetical protein
MNISSNTPSDDRPTSFTRDYKASNALFQFRLFDLIENPLSSVQWCADGKSFIVIGDRNLAIKHYPCFRYSSFTSFQRQLNIYGFACKKGNRAELEYLCPPSFFRGCSKDELMSMKRFPIKKDKIIITHKKENEKNRPSPVKRQTVSSNTQNKRLRFNSEDDTSSFDSMDSDNEHQFLPGYRQCNQKMKVAMWSYEEYGSMMMKEPIYDLPLSYFEEPGDSELKEEFDVSSFFF